MERSLAGYSFPWNSKDLSGITWFTHRYYYGKTYLLEISNDQSGLGFRVYFVFR